jgi:zinc protease
LPAGLALMADVIRNPRFTAETLGRVRTSVAGELRRQQVRGAVVAEDVFRQTLFGPNDRYGVPLVGTSASLERIHVEDVGRFHNDLWTPRRVAFVVTGDIVPDEARRALEHAFGHWPARAVALAPPAPETPSSPRRRRIIVVPRNGSQASLAIGRIGVSRSSTDWVALDVLNRAFGGSYASRINLNLRERHGYAYSARSRFTENRTTGAFMIHTAVVSSKTAAAISELLEELTAIHVTPPAGEELQLAKDGVSLGVAGRNESNEQLAEMLERIPAFGLPIDYLDRYVAEVRGLTPEKLRAAAQSAFRTDDLVLVVVGPLDAVRAQLSASGLVPFEIGAPGDGPAPLR